MKFPRRLLLLGSAALLALPALTHAQNKAPIRLLVGFPPGGATDAITRAVADKLPALLGQPVIVDNKPGVGGRIAADMVLADDNFATIVKVCGWRECRRVCVCVCARARVCGQHGARVVNLATFFIFNVCIV